MNLLAIDTTTKVASVAIQKEEAITMHSISNEITHSEKLLPLIDSTLKEVKLTINDIDTYAVINGPGSFTGLRIGLATLKAFAMITQAKIFSLSSTKLLAIIGYQKALRQKLIQPNEPCFVATIIDARNDRVYYSVEKIMMNAQEEILTLESVLETSNDIIQNSLQQIQGHYVSNDNVNLTNNMLIVGDCVEKFAHEIDTTLSTIAKFNYYPTSSDLIYAYQHLPNKEAYMHDTFTLDANYARKSQAERLKTS